MAVSKNQGLTYRPQYLLWSVETELPRRASNFWKCSCEFARVRMAAYVVVKCPTTSLTSPVSIAVSAVTVPADAAADAAPWSCEATWAFRS